MTQEAGTSAIAVGSVLQDLEGIELDRQILDGVALVVELHEDFRHFPDHVDTLWPADDVRTQFVGGGGCSQRAPD